ncbi:hypothetical protein J41TS4_14400 [Paenibacillus apis]|uniref:Uncharacterized protein n=1 Tax=Paenibacillus apis TaxID=1792174 RepID=A0A920CM34_9BACL|nr:hypothetical protein J41TS4_14400 [Paenibacillus apis]
MSLFLYHYFEKEQGPFKNLSKLSVQDAIEVSHVIRKEGNIFASQRSDEYIVIRRELEKIAREQFILKGGKPTNTYPHYMTLGPCSWLQSWYKEAAFLKLSWDVIPKELMSFTYGDLFPTMRYEDNKPYRKQVYTREEIVGVIDQFRLPQDWNADGSRGPERYIEVQIWDEQILEALIQGLSFD